MPTPRPRSLDDLPYASHLVPFGGSPSEEDYYDGVHFDGGEFEEEDEGGARFMECAFSSVVFTGGRYRRARFDEVWMHGVRWVGSDLVDTGWLDAEVIESILAGLEMFGAELRRVTFHGCKLDSVNLRTARLREVTFVDCLLRDVDFGGAKLTGVAFPGSTLEDVRFDQAQLAKVDLREAVRVGIASGVDSLKGATISDLQLLDLAPAFARVLGVTVDARPVGSSEPR